MAYDIDGYQLDEAISSEGGDVLEILTVSAPNIAYVLIHPDEDVLLDDFVFELEAPQCFIASVM